MKLKKYFEKTKQLHENDDDDTIKLYRMFSSQDKPDSDYNHSYDDKFDIESQYSLKDVFKVYPCPQKPTNFKVSGLGLVDLKGCPPIINGVFAVSQNKLKNFEDFPKIIKSHVYLDGNPIESLHNIHYHIHEIGGELFIPRTIKSHMMGVMKIKGLKSIHVSKPTISPPELKQACAILNRHLDGKGNFFDCLEDLEDAGLEEFAQL